MYKTEIRYRIIAQEIIEDNLNAEDADYALGVLKDQGRTDLFIEEYNPEKYRIGRNPDLH